MTKKYVDKAYASNDSNKKGKKKLRKKMLEIKKS